MAALIQREHIKNKRFSDFVDSTTVNERQNLQRVTDRLTQSNQQALKSSGMEVTPTSDYGDMPRQLGVTPFPAPPQTVVISEQQSSAADNYHKSETPVPPPVEKPNYPEFSPIQESITEEKKKGFPWVTTLAGTALGASVAANGLMLYKAYNPPAPANSSSTIEISSDPGMGAVGIQVE
jgi:hypothetical protein